MREVGKVEGLPAFDRRFLDGKERITAIGRGAPGGKASGLIRIQSILRERVPDGHLAGLPIDVPALTVITADVFDLFMERGRLHALDFSRLSDDRIAHAFQQADMPVEILGDLRALAAGLHVPLAVRSSSILEDALYQPFAGVYGTKMIPNNQHDPDVRFRKLTEAVKFVWASTFFRDARAYLQATGRSSAAEKMAVIVQEVVGRRHGPRFYPDVAGVARSYNFYPLGHARPEDGVVQLALGLGRSIVSGGVAWAYSPAFPRATPPFASARDRLKKTQSRFWAVNMGEPPAYDPLTELEYLVEAELADAEWDGTLALLASTYDVQADRIVPGTAGQGPRVLDFAPLLVLEEVALNAALEALLGICEQALGQPVEIEFAANLCRPGRGVSRLGFLQVRPLVVSAESVSVPVEELACDRALVASERVLGNGETTGIRDIVYVRPERFSAARSPEAALQVAQMNAMLREEGRFYVLIGFGRWGSSDPWLGIPVTWSQISGARAIVEATMEGMDIEPSQGSHFFHNLTSFQVSYFSAYHRDRYQVDWRWLDSLVAVRESELVRWVRFEEPVVVRVDGRAGRGVILRPAGVPRA